MCPPSNCFHDEVRIFFLSEMSIIKDFFLILNEKFLHSQVTYPREIIISTQLLREHQLSHILQGWVFMLLHSPTLFPSHSVSYLQIRTWLGPRCYLLKLTFRSGWSQCTWQGGGEPRLQGRKRLQEAEREAAACVGNFGEGNGQQQHYSRTQQQSQICSQACHSHREYREVPRSLPVGQAKASPTSAPSS